MYNSIAQKLYEILPDDWDDVVMYAHVEKNVYEMFFYVRVDGKYINCYSMDKVFGISRAKVIACFDDIYKILYPDYEEKEWYTATIKLNDQGDFLMYYDYNDEGLEEIPYHKMWKEKYVPAE